MPDTAPPPPTVVRVAIGRSTDRVLRWAWHVSAKPDLSAGGLTITRWGAVRAAARAVRRADV